MEINWQRIHEDLSAPFPENELKTRPGRGGMIFTYVDARAVMDRLDAVVGPGAWSTHEDVVDAASACVRCALTIHGVTRTDFGYPNNPVAGKGAGEEPIKEGASDALRRAGVQFGIARYLYQGGGSSTPRPQPQQQAATAPRPLSTAEAMGRETTLASERTGRSREDLINSVFAALALGQPRANLPDKDAKRVIAWLREQQREPVATTADPLSF